MKVDGQDSILWSKRYKILLRVKFKNEQVFKHVIVIELVNPSFIRSLLSCLRMRPLALVSNRIAKCYRSTLCEKYPYLASTINSNTCSFLNFNPSLCVYPYLKHKVSATNSTLHSLRHTAPTQQNSLAHTIISFYFFAFVSVNVKW